MNEMQKQLAEDLIRNVAAASDSAKALTLLTGDPDFRLLAAMLEMMLTAKAKGDIEDFARACTDVAAQKMAAAAGGSAIESIIVNFNGIAN